MSDKRFFTIETITLTELSKLCNANLTDNKSGSQIVTGCASLKSATKSDISFFEVGRFVQKFISTIKVDLDNTKALAVFVKESDLEYLPKNVTGLITSHPKQAFLKALEVMYKEETEYSIASSAKISPSVKFKDKSKVFIGENVVIEDNVEIGSNTIIQANSVIKSDCIIGDNVKIESLVVISHAIIGNNCVFSRLCQIGAAGFGYESNEQGHKYVPQIGRVILEDDVEVGAGSCVDRGALDDTFVGQGTKIDDLVMVGHGCVIGKHCLLCGQVGLAGNTILGDFVICGGQAGLGGHLTVGSFAQIGAQSGIMADVAPHSKIMGSPGINVRDFFKLTALTRQFIKQGK